MEEIGAAHRALVLRHHPDTGGTVERFMEIQAAFEAACLVRASEVKGLDGKSQRDLLELRMEEVLMELEILEEDLQTMRREVVLLGDAWEMACTPGALGEDDWEDRNQSRQDVFGPMSTLEQQVQEVPSCTRAVLYYSG